MRKIWLFYHLPRSRGLGNRKSSRSWWNEKTHIQVRACVSQFPTNMKHDVNLFPKKILHRSISLCPPYVQPCIYAAL